MNTEPKKGLFTTEFWATILINFLPLFNTMAQHNFGLTDSTTLKDVAEKAATNPLGALAVIVYIICRASNKNSQTKLATQELVVQAKQLDMQQIELKSQNKG